MAEKELVGQRNRAMILMTEIIGDRYAGMAYAVETDVHQDRVIVTAGSTTIAELAPKHWHMSDQELRGFLLANATEKLGPGTPPRFREPEV